MTTPILTDRRIILLGKTGNGKSSTGNSLLGRQAFHYERSLNSVTQICHVKSVENYERSTKYVIVDTPGLMDMEEKLADRALELQRSVTICPEPHAFLLIFSSNDRITKDEELTIDVLRVLFGEKVFEHCIVVFTHGISFSSADDFKKYWMKSDMMVNLVERCGGRIARIENHSSVDSDSNEDAQCILAMIEDMSDSGHNMFVYPWLSSHRRALKEHLGNYKGKANVHEELSALVGSLGKTLSPEIWTDMLVYGVAFGVGVVVGVAGPVVCATYLVGGALIGQNTGGKVMSSVARAGSAFVEAFAEKVKFV